MPYLETPDELAEWLADKIGVYGGHDEACGGPECKRPRRICWTGHVVDRMRAAVENENRLAEGRGTEPRKEPGK